MMFDLPVEERPQPTVKLLEQWVRDAEDITKGTRKRIGWMGGLNRRHRRFTAGVGG